MTKEDVRNVIGTVDGPLGEEIDCRFNGILIPIDGFLTVFGDAECTYLALSNHPNTTPGYQAIFDSLHDQGRLP